MAKPKGKNAAASASKTEKLEETNNATVTESEPEKMDEEVAAVANEGVEVVGEENKGEEATEGDTIKEETEQDENEEEMEENWNEEVLEDNKDEEKMEENKSEDNLEEETKKEGTNGDEVENTPGKKGRRPRKRNKKGGQGAGDAKSGEKSDKPESSSKETDGKKAESMGMIFMCSSKTKKDCFQYKVLGLPAAKKDQVEKIYKGMRLFLFDIDTKLMHGIFRAAAPGGYNLEPKAFKSAFPAQVRFSVMEDCKPLHEEKFKAAIKKNYYGKNKFNTILDSAQVRDLCKLFKKSKAGAKSKQVDKPIKQESRGGGRDRDRRQGRDRGRHLPYAGPRERIYREPFRGYERDPYASAILPPPLPPRPVYVYDRPLEADYYRRPLDLEPHRDDYAYSDPYAYREPRPYPEPGYLAGPPAGYYPRY